MIPHTHNQQSLQFQTLYDKPLIVHGICDHNILQARELPANAFGVAVVRQVAYGALVAICSECPNIFHNAEAISSVLNDPKRVMKISQGHSNVLVEIAKNHDVLPLKLGTVCASQTQVRQLLDQNAERFSHCLSQIINAVEYGIEIIQTYHTKHDPLAGPSIQGQSPSQGAGQGQVPNLHQSPSDGQIYAQYSNAQICKSSDLHQGFITDLLQSMTFFVKDSKILAMPNKGQVMKSKYIFNAAFLVDRANAEAFISCALSYNELAQAKGLSMALSGPWPAYNFVSVMH